MTRLAPMPPAETDLLCEFCGYTLNGLDEASNCPECGMPIAASLGQKRRPPRWERADRGNSFAAFISDSVRIIFRPTAFFKNVTTRGDVKRAGRFGRLQWIIASVLFGIAGSIHTSLNGTYSIFGNVLAGPLGMPIVAAIAYLGLWGTTWLAVRLTAWEAAYRGYRLSRPVVMRAMYYHAAHYLPVAIIAALTVVSYKIWTLRDPMMLGAMVKYLYIISAEIIIAAAYLFKTYWIGMRNMMYANV